MLGFVGHNMHLHVYLCWNSRQEYSPAPLFTKRQDVLPPNLTAKSREIGIALKFDRHLGSAAAELPVKI